MNDIFADVEPMVQKSGINVPYSWWAGDTASTFFRSLRDDKKIIGTKCNTCNKVFIPPRKTCPTCFTENKEWVDVSNEGTLLSYTVARRQLASLPKKAPVVFGLIKLDEASTAILHLLDEIDPGDVKIGMRVKAQFAEDRKGGIRDIAYFKPIKQ